MSDTTLPLRRPGSRLRLPNTRFKFLDSDWVLKLQRNKYLKLKNLKITKICVKSAPYLKTKKDSFSIKYDAFFNC